MLGERLGPAPLQVDQGQHVGLGAGPRARLGLGVGDADQGLAPVRPEHGGHDDQPVGVGPGLDGPEHPDHLVEAEHRAEAAVAPPQPQAPGQLVGPAQRRPAAELAEGHRAGQPALGRVGDQGRAAVGGHVVQAAGQGGQAPARPVEDPAPGRGHRGERRAPDPEAADPEQVPVGRVPGRAGRLPAGRDQAPQRPVGQPPHGGGAVGRAQVDQVAVGGQLGRAVVGRRGQQQRGHLDVEARRRPPGRQLPQLAQDPAPAPVGGLGVDPPLLVGEQQRPRPPQLLDRPAGPRGRGRGPGRPGHRRDPPPPHHPLPGQPADDQPAHHRDHRHDQGHPPPPPPPLGQRLRRLVADRPPSRPHGAAWAGQASRVPVTGLAVV